MREAAGVAWRGRVRQRLTSSTSRMYIVRMVIGFAWDYEKARENLRKHGVSFEEAVTIFENVPMEVYFDPDHSDSETRYLGIGFSNRSRLLVVVHSENRNGTEIRIISARRATARERRDVFGGNR